jgi:polysaccharide biosynthesis/export protein
MQIKLPSRGARWGAAIFAITALAGCGGSMNESVTASLQGPTPEATAGLGVPPTDGPPPSRARVAKVVAPAGLTQEVRALERASTPGSDGYRIGPQDVLEISVYRAPDLAKTVQVAESGTVNLPLVGEVQAGGVTAQELERTLKTKLGAKYLENPQVTVFVREYNSQRVTVEGAVEKPGVYPYRGRVSLLELIATAGGTREVANGSDVMIFRTAAGGKQAARFDIDDIRAGRATDPPIMQGDIVIVNTSVGKKLYQDILKTLPLVGVFAMIL